MVTLTVVLLGLWAVLIVGTFLTDLCFVSLVLGIVVFLLFCCCGLLLAGVSVWMFLVFYCIV